MKIEKTMDRHLTYIRHGDATIYLARMSWRGDGEYYTTRKEALQALRDMWARDVATYHRNTAGKRLSQERVDELDAELAKEEA